MTTDPRLYQDAITAYNTVIQQESNALSLAMAAGAQIDAAYTDEVADAQHEYDAVMRRPGTPLPQLTAAHAIYEARRDQALVQARKGRETVQRLEAHVREQATAARALIAQTGLPREWLPLLLADVIPAPPSFPTPPLHALEGSLSATTAAVQTLRRILAALPKRRPRRSPDGSVIRTAAIVAFGLFVCLWVWQSAGGGRIGRVVYSTPTVMPYTRPTSAPPTARPAGTLPRTVLSGHTRSVTALTWSPNGKMVASASNDATIRLWQASGALYPMPVLAVDRPVDIVWSPDSQYLAASSYLSPGYKTTIWNLQGQQVASLSGATDPVWSADSTRILTDDFYGEAQIWTVAGKLVSVFTVPSGSVQAVAWLPDTTTIVAGTSTNVYMWNVDGRLLHTLDIPFATRIAVSPLGDYISVVADKGVVYTIDANGKIITRVADPKVDQTHAAKVLDVEWSPNDSAYAVVFDTGSAAIWKADGTLQSVLENSGATRLAWLGGNARVALGYADGHIQVKDVLAHPVMTLAGDSRVESLALSPDTRTLAAGGTDGKVRLYNAP